MTTIILVRHGENEWVKKHRLAGWLPGVHLNENGRKQAESAAERLKDVHVDFLYSSPVERCMETAEYIANAKAMTVQQLPEIGEVRYGDWEGAKIRKLARKKLWHAVQFFPSRMRFPKGEALREVQFRAVQALEKLSEQHPNDTIVVVSHADLIKLVLAHYLGIHMDLFQRIVISPASLNVIGLYGNGMMRVMRLNDTGAMEMKKPEKKKRQKKRKKGSPLQRVRLKISKNKTPD